MTEKHSEEAGPGSADNESPMIYNSPKSEMMEAEVVPEVDAPEADKDADVCSDEDVDMINESVDVTGEMVDAEEQMADVPQAPDFTKTPTRIRVKPASGRKTDMGTPPVSTPEISKGGKKLNRKASRRSLGVLNLDAQAGDMFLVKLKGYPAWPAIICDEDMLPLALTETRPKTAARPNGSYDAEYADGGKREIDRTFAVMYLATNEFGWVSNSSLTPLSAARATEAIKENMRKDLKAAFEVAANDYDLDHFKDLLTAHRKELLLLEKASKATNATPVKSRGKSKVAEPVDAEMDSAADADAVAEPVIPQRSKSRSKKRKAEEEEVATPVRTNSVKKPKIVASTSSSAKATINGDADEKVVTEDLPKATKTRNRSGTQDKAAKKANTDELAQKPAEQPVDEFAKKKKTVLYLRLQLQKGLLFREDKPKDEEMARLSEVITKLENQAELAVPILRETKINKALRAILKVDHIPLDKEFQFKARSRALVEKWEKILAADAAATGTATVTAREREPEAKPDAPANGVHMADETTNTFQETDATQAIQATQVTQPTEATEATEATEKTEATEATEAIQATEETEAVMDTEVKSEEKDALEPIPSIE